MNTRKLRRIAQAIRLSRKGIPMYGAIPLRFLADPAWRDRHLIQPRVRMTIREWDRHGVPDSDRGAA